MTASATVQVLVSETGEVLNLGLRIYNDAGLVLRFGSVLDDAPMLLEVSE
jgi:hypothetical protein